MRMQASEKVVLNTGFLYGKMLITLFISLYSTRLVLSALGEDNFGIFNLVAGVIALLTFLNGAMAVSTQRYLSFYMGAGQTEKLKAVFQSSVLLHLLIGIAVAVLLEIGGIYLINNVLSIPAERVEAAKLVFHFMVISTFFTINAVPFDAAINAHEDMLFDSLVGVFQSFLKLGIAFWLIGADMDRLILYGLLIALMRILIRFIKSIYCTQRYEECKIRFNMRFDMRLVKEMFSFAGWNLFGAFCNVLRNQGIAVVLNIYFGVIVNAAYGIANQVNGQLISFSTNMIRALNPQIAKSEGSGDRKRMLKLAMLGSKVSFLLLAFFTIPLFLEMEYVLNLWLEEVPEYSIIFCQLVLLSSLVQQLTVGIMRAIQSAGKIKAYQTAVGTTLILNIPLAFIIIKLGFAAQYVLVGVILIEVIASGLRIWFAQRLTGLDTWYFINRVVFRSIFAVSLTLLISYMPSRILEPSFLRLVITTLVSIVFFLLIVFKFGFSREESLKIKEISWKFLRSFRDKVFVSKRSRRRPRNP